MISRAEYDIALKVVKTYNSQNTLSTKEQHLLFAEKITNVFDVDMEMIKSGDRKREIGDVRMVIVAFLYRRFKGIKDYQIGKVVNRHRTSVIHSKNKFAYMKQYSEIKEMVRKVELEIN